MPWPFGLFDVNVDGLAVRSWHWSWWLRGRQVARSEIEEIRVRRRFGVVILVIQVKCGKPWKVEIANSPDRVLRDLSSHGVYPNV